MSTNKKSYKNIWWNAFYYIFSIFLAMLCFTVVLYSYNNKAEEDNKTLKNKLDLVEKSISSLEGKEEIKVYKKYDDNRDYFDLLLIKSDVSRFMDHIETILSDNNLNFEGFNYSDGKISVWVISKSDTKDKMYNDAYKTKLDYVKAHDFIDWYKSYKSAIFNMKDVNKFISWDDVRFNVIFELKWGL